MFEISIAKMRVFREEIPGPFLVASKFRKVEDAITLANSVEYGITATVLSPDPKTAEAMARADSGTATNPLGSPNACASAGSSRSRRGSDASDTYRPLNAVIAARAPSASNISTASAARSTTTSRILRSALGTRDNT